MDIYVEELGVFSQLEEQQIQLFGISEQFGRKVRGWLIGICGAHADDS